MYQDTSSSRTDVAAMQKAVRFVELEFPATSGVLGGRELFRTYWNSSHPVASRAEGGGRCSLGAANA